MAVNPLQSTGTTPVLSGAGTTTLTCTLPVAPTEGNLLVFLMAGDKDTGTLTLLGFTQQHVITGADVSLYMAYRTSDGTEQSISPVWANPSAAGNTAWYAELEDTVVTGSTYWQVSGSDAVPYDSNPVKIRGTGTLALTTYAGLSIAAWGVDNGGSVSTGARAYSNSYTERVTSHTVLTLGGIFAASKVLAAGAATDCIFSYSGIGTIADQISGCVAVFSKLPSVPGNSSGSFAVLGAAPTGSFSVRDSSSGGWEVIGEGQGDMAGKGDSEGDMTSLGSSSGTFTKGV